MAKKIGLSLAAGGARGLAHIGVLQVLQREKIPIDFIAGASMGALVAAAYAAGTDLEFMAKLAVNINRSLFIDVTLPRMGLLKGDKALEIIRLLTHNKKFSQLNIPLAVIATDIERGEKVTFKEGNVAEAIRASISIPGIFQPVRVEDRLLVDGAVIEKLPVKILKEMGADVIVAVDVRFWTPEKDETIKISNIYEVIMQSMDILESEANKNCLKLADVVIRPRLKKVSSADFQKAEEIIMMGRRAAEDKIAPIMRRLNGSDKKQVP